MATQIDTSGFGPLATAADNVGPQGPQNAGMFAGVDPDETGVPAAEGALGVINPDVTPGVPPGSNGPTPGR